MTPLFSPGWTPGSVTDRAHTAMPAGFTLTFRERDDDRDCSVAFDAGHYDPAKVQRFIAKFVRLIELAATNPDRTASDLSAATAPAT